MWYWTAPVQTRGRPPGSSDDWERDVGCALIDGDRATFFDPLLPEDAEHLEFGDPLANGERCTC